MRGRDERVWQSPGSAFRRGAPQPAAVKLKPQAFCTTGVSTDGVYCCPDGCEKCGGAGSGTCFGVSCSSLGLSCSHGGINALSYPDKECILANDDFCRIQSGFVSR